jgi:uncharacterized membrane protein YjjP (DUF1212 family)
MSSSKSEVLANELSDISLEKNHSARRNSKEWKHSSETLESLQKLENHQLNDEELGQARSLTESELNIVIPFLVRLCHALHLYGAPAHRVEYNMFTVSKRFGLDAQFAVMPTIIICTFNHVEGRKAETHIIRTNQTLDCAKLELVDELCDEIVNRTVSLMSAIEELEKINNRPPLVNKVVWVLVFGLLAGSIGPLFFQCDWYDVFYAFALGVVVGLVCLLGEKRPAFGRLVEIASSCLVAFLARVIYTFTRICVGGVTLSAIVWLLPGLSLTIGVTELATRNVVSGTSRVFSALLTAFQLGIGIAIGTNIAVWLSSVPLTCSSEFSAWYNFLFFPLTAVSLIILLNARFKQWPAMFVACAVAYLASYFGGLYFPSVISSAIASFGVVVTGRLP